MGVLSRKDTAFIFRAEVTKEKKINLGGMEE